MRYVRGQYLNDELKEENAALRARIAELKKERDALMAGYEMDLANIRALKANATARAEKAEAESKRRHELLVDVARAINALEEDLVAIPAAIREAEHLAMRGVRDINDGTWISQVALLLHRIAEEGK